MYPCPEWLEEALLEYPEQIRETDNFDGSARGIVLRLLERARAIDEQVKMNSASVPMEDDYFRGLQNGLLLAQATLYDMEYKPI